MLIMSDGHEEKVEEVKWIRLMLYAKFVSRKTSEKFGLASRLRHVKNEEDHSGMVHLRFESIFKAPVMCI